MNKEEFKIFLDSEIDNLRDEIQRPGWTNWALLGAVAGLIWLLLELVEVGQYSVKHVAGILLVIWFLDYSYFFIKSLISPNLSKTTGRFMPNQEVSSNRLGILFSLFQLGFLIYIVHEFTHDVSSLTSNLAFTAVSILLFSALGAFIVPLTGYPLPINVRNRYTVIIPITSCVVMLISAWYYSHFLWVTPGGANVYDVRFALVIAAIYYLISRLLAASPGALTLDILTTVRREYLLGRIELETAIRQTDIALSGMRVSDLIEEYVAKLLSLYRDANVELSK